MKTYPNGEGVSPSEGKEQKRPKKRLLSFKNFQKQKFLKGQQAFAIRQFSRIKKKRR